MSLATELKQFTGTENWYKHPLSAMLYTDGVKHFAEAAGAYWFVDTMAFVVYPLSQKEGMAAITLTVANDEADITVTDGDESVLWAEHITYTDCPEGTYEFFLYDGVLLLRTEY